MQEDTTTYTIREFRNDSDLDARVQLGSTAADPILLSDIEILTGEVEVYGLFSAPDQDDGRFYIPFNESNGSTGKIAEFDGIDGALREIMDLEFPIAPLPDNGFQGDSVFFGTTHGLLYLSQIGTAEIALSFFDFGTKTTQVLNVAFSGAAGSAAQVTQIATQGTLAYLVVDYQTIFLLDITAALDNPDGNHTAEHVHTTGQPISAFAAHNDDLYYTVASTEPDTDVLHRATAAGSVLETVLMPGGSGRCVRLHGLRGTVSDDGNVYKGDYLYLMMQTTSGHQLYGYPIGYGLANELPGPITAPDSYRNNLAGMDVSTAFGSVYLLAGSQVFVANATLGLRIRVNQGEGLLLPTSDTPIPPSADFLIANVETIDSAVIREGELNFSGIPDAPVFQLNGIPLILSNAGAIQNGKNNLMRIVLEKNDGGDVIISIMDIDPGTLSVSRWQRNIGADMAD